MRLLAAPALLALALIAASTAPALAQEDPETPVTTETAKPDDPSVLLSRALKRFKSADDLVVTAKVDHQAAAVAGMGGAFGGAQVVEVIQGMGEPFEGEVEAWRGADGATVVVSRDELPGFCLYRTDARTIVQQTYEKETATLEQLEAELCAILEPDRFTTNFLNAELKPTRDERTGAWTFRGAVSRKIVRVTKPRVIAGVEIELPNQTRVLRAEGRLVVSAEGELTEIEIKVVRSVSTIMRGMLAQGGGARDDDEHDREGDATVYTLRVGAPRPSDRAKAFKDTARRLAGAGR